jgi:hypothetical protein
MADNVEPLARRLRELLPPQPTVQAVEKAAGQVWLAPVRGERGVSTLVLLTRVGDGGARGVVTCDRVWIAATDDVIIPATSTTAGSALAACLWRDVPVDPASLATFVAEIDRPIVEAITMLLQQRLTGGFTREPIGRVARETVPGANEAAPRLLRWRITSPKGTAREFLSGPRLLSDDDPRAEARAAFYEATRHVEERALSRLDLTDAADTTGADAAGSIWAATLRRIRAALERAGAVIEDATSPTNPVSGMLAGLLGFGPVGGALGAAVGPQAVLRRLFRKTDPVPHFEPPSTFAALVSLGTVRVELQFDADDDTIGVSGVAFLASDDRPVLGVIATFHMDPPEGEAAEVTRTTEAPEGDFGRFALPRIDGARYALSLSHGDDNARVEW